MTRSSKATLVFAGIGLAAGIAAWRHPAARALLEVARLPIEPDHDRHTAEDTVRYIQHHHQRPDRTTGARP